MCGVVGLVSKEPVNQRLYDALLLLQHRGQDAAGIGTLDGLTFHSYKAMGLVRDVFRTRNMRDLTGNIGIGHVRYPTQGCASSNQESQPFYVNAPYGIMFAHNGNLTNAEEVKDNLWNVDRRHINTVALIAGKGLLAFRDPHGIRPLCFGTRVNADGSKDYLVSSESVTMVGLEFQFERDVAPGEAVFISQDGEFSCAQCAEHPMLNPCAFEFVYFARPDSVIDGISVYGARLRLGEYLANEIASHIDLSEIDCVMPIPDSSRPAAQQLAQKLNIPYREGFIKNRYIGRTFIMPGQTTRKKSVRQKLNAMPVEFEGKNILLVDDSIVRGTTMEQIVRMARESGAKKVYVASSAPRVMYPNVYGIDMPTRAELICGHGESAEEVAKRIGADAVVYQTVEGLKDALTDLNPRVEQFDCSCFDGVYVTGDITKEYLDKLEADRMKPKAPAAGDDE